MVVVYDGRIARVNRFDTDFCRFLRIRVNRCGGSIYGVGGAGGRRGAETDICTVNATTGRYAPYGRFMRIWYPRIGRSPQTPPRAAMGDFYRRGGYRATGCCAGGRAAPVCSIGRTGNTFSVANTTTNTTAKLLLYYRVSRRLSVYHVTIYSVILQILQPIWAIPPGGGAGRRALFCCSICSIRT